MNETMEVTCHVGPERSWTELSEFLDGASKELVSSIYQFHAQHIAEAIEDELDSKRSLKIVMDKKTRDPRNNKIKKGDFDRSETFDAWEKKFTSRFDRIFVPTGKSGLVSNSYHIKVTVRDGNRFWLSSGNWKRTSQPKIAKSKLNDIRHVNRSGNREWHTVIQNRTLADRFRNHILADFDAAKDLGGTIEAPFDAPIYVDIPDVTIDLETIELESSRPDRLLEPLTVKRKVKVKPILTPDRKGKVYRDAVLRLIHSADRQLVFQNQYIKMRGARSGFLKDLVDALVEKSQELDDFRLLLRSGFSDLKENLVALKKRGMDVNRHVRVVPRSHTKGIIVDGERALVGSHNWSSSGVTLNRDASLLFFDREIANYYLEAFNIDWDRARNQVIPEAVTARTPRVATGATPPPGFTRVLLEDLEDD